MDGQGDHGGPVAIIGVACRFPGASDPAGFHRLSVTGRRMFRPVAAWPGGELHAALLDDWAAAPVSSGDPGPGAEDAEPVTKLAAETTALALSDAGLRDAASRTRTGLIIASSAPGVSGLVREELGFATDLAYPQAAALSSLHALVVAAQAVAAGDLDLAVAGGAELGFDPVWLALQARAGTLGTSQMRVYAADPAGLLPGDGCGIVVLARSADARAAGVPVYAEVAGWTAGPEASEAYQQAGVDPADIQLIEGQGTGTAAADLAELTALAGLRRGARTAAALGAVSADIGYARAAAGAASLIRTALAMAAGTIPPGTGCARPHPLIESGDARLRLPAAQEPWPDAGPARLAAVNSLGTAQVAAMHGLTGLREVAGVHLVLRRDSGHGGRAGRRRRTDREADAPAESPHAPMPPLRVAEPDCGSGSQPSVFALCGGNPGELAGRLDAIAASVEALSAAEVREVARHLAFGVLAAGDRGAPVRVALAAAAPCQLAERARSAARLLRAGGTGAAAGPGVHVCAGAAGRVVVLFGGLAGSGLTYTALLAASLAALRTLEVLGVRPGAGVGYSLGELAGLAWAGCLPAAEAARLAAQCDQVLRGCACAPAAMVRLGADAETARGLCAPDRVHIAAYEGPRTHVLAGSTSGVRELARRAAALGIAADVLPGLHALHCPAMTGCTAPLRGVFAGTRFAPPRRPLASTVTGRLVMPADDLAEQLARQLSLPVLFAQAMTLAAGEADLVVVAGPDEGLAALAAGCCGVPAVAVTGTAPAGPADAARNTPADTVAALFAAGAVTDLAPFMAAPAPADALAIPRMREGEPPERRAAEPPERRAAEPAGRHREAADREPGRRTTARSG
jgi:enediyne polyketide synthase